MTFSADETRYQIGHRVRSRLVVLEQRDVLAGGEKLGRIATPIVGKDAGACIVPGLCGQLVVPHHRVHAGGRSERELVAGCYPRPVVVVQVQDVRLDSRGHRHHARQLAVAKVTPGKGRTQ
uniref:Uncharacterized protein n=1 Tax=Anopheles merus TaxID=30066 RepID=A0A182V237_ANOME